MSECNETTAQKDSILMGADTHIKNLNWIVETRSNQLAESTIKITSLEKSVKKLQTRVKLFQVIAIIAGSVAVVLFLK